MTEGEPTQFPKAVGMPFGEFLGPWPDRVELEVEHLERVDCGSYVREKVSYAVCRGQRVSAYVCIPTGPEGPLPAVFCHHQHASNFGLGKSEVVGLDGDPDQAYARELAERGFLTVAPGAIGFEERNWSPDGRSNVAWFELSTRLVQGRTLLASCRHEVSVALDYLVSRDDVNPARLGFIGHSYGGRMALWAPAFDPRITASVSNCGCIPYRQSHTRDTGIQAEFVVPGFAAQYDLEDVISRYGESSSLLISAGRADKWSRGAQEVYDGARRTLGDRWSSRSMTPRTCSRPRCEYAPTTSCATGADTQRRPPARRPGRADVDERVATEAVVHDHGAPDAVGNSSGATCSQRQVSSASERTWESRNSWVCAPPSALRLTDTRTQRRTEAPDRSPQEHAATAASKDEHDASARTSHCPRVPARSAVTAPAWPGRRTSALRTFPNATGGSAGVDEVPCVGPTERSLKVIRC